MRPTLAVLLVSTNLATAAAAQTRAIPACTAATSVAQDAVTMLTALHAVAQACIAGDAASAPCTEILAFFRAFDGQAFTDDLRTMERGMTALCGLTR